MFGKTERGDANRRTLAPLAGCGKSHDFGKTDMKQAPGRNADHAKSMGYGQAEVRDWQRNDGQPTFSAPCYVLLSHKNPT